MSPADGGGVAGYQNMLLVKRVVAIADKKGCTPGQLALAWVQVRNRVSANGQCPSASVTQLWS